MGLFDLHQPASVPVSILTYPEPGNGRVIMRTLNTLTGLAGRGGGQIESIALEIVGGTRRPKLSSGYTTSLR